MKHLFALGAAIHHGQRQRIIHPASSNTKQRSQ